MWFKKKTLNPIERLTLPELRLLNEFRLLKDSINRAWN